MPEKTCPTHKLTLDFVAEGVSKKSGKRYSAFYSCPNRDCKYSENIPEQQGHFLSMQADFRRSKEIAYFNSTNAAVEITKAFEHKTTKEVFEEITKARKMLYEQWEEWYIENVIEEK